MRPDAETVEMAVQNVIAESPDTDFTITNPFTGIQEQEI